MAAVNDREIVGAGTPEAQWRSSRQLQAVPRAARSEIVPAHSRLVVVAPHPDDEVIACGGLLAQHIAEGGRAVVIIVTDGGASHVGCAEWPRDRLVAERQRESERGLGLLGIASSQITRLQVPDGQVRQHLARVQAELHALLQPGDTVVTTWRLDGHPDHEATGEATAAACQAADCTLLEAPVWAWHWAAPEDSRLPWHRMRCLPLDELSSHRKQQAMACHRSQLTPRSTDEGPVISQHGVDRVARRFEVYLV